MESGAKKMRAIWKCVRDGYVKFVEKQGFPIIVTLCVAVITATALWTGKQETAYVSPTPPVTNDVSAVQLMQQSLREAVTPTPAPTEAPRLWQAPLAEIVVLREYTADSMLQSGMTGVWTIHDAIDLEADRGSKVFAMSDGTVVDSGENKLLGVWVQIDHGDGVEALYAGLALNNGYLAGDEVRAGAVIGYSGSGLLEESDMPPHLHLRVTRDGVTIDPATLWTAQS